jgi:hypothetical protein
MYAKPVWQMWSETLTAQSALAARQREFVETDLDVLATLLDLTETYYRLNRLQDGDRVLAKANQGVSAIWHLISNNRLIEDAEAERFKRACNKLHRESLRIQRARKFRIASVS